MNGDNGVQHLAVFDLDGTILDGHSPVLMVYRLYRTGIIPFSTGLHILWWGIRYKLHFEMEQQVVRERIFKTLVHFPVADANKLMIDLYREELEPRLRPEALKRIQLHQQRGDKVILASASFWPILEQLAGDIGADGIVATRMEVIDGYYTGSVAQAPPEGEQKLIQVRALANRLYGADNWELAWAYGDHFSDRALLGAARNPVAVTPGKRLKRLARSEGWRIEDWSL
jgi:HAD superfamily hydrolase (TIGR01490 family)